MAEPEVLFTVGSVVEQRVENERSSGAFGRGRRRLRTVARIEHTRLLRRLGLGVGRRGRCIGPAGARRQIEPTLAAAAGKRQRHHTQENDGPHRSSRTQVNIHDDIPKSGRTIQRLPCHGESNMTVKLQRKSYLQPYFRCFSSRFAHPFACAATFLGAVPPKLVRLFTEASTESTFSASTVILGSTSCIAFSGNSCSATPSLAASATMRPVTWWASRKGIFKVRTSQSARSVAVA